MYTQFSIGVNPFYFTYQYVTFWVAGPKYDTRWIKKTPDKIAVLRLSLSLWRPVTEAQMHDFFVTTNEQLYPIMNMLISVFRNFFDRQSILYDGSKTANRLSQVEKQSVYVEAIKVKSDKKSSLRAKLSTGGLLIILSYTNECNY